MPLTPLQKGVVRILAAHRKRLRQSINGDRTVTLTGDLCIDGTSPEGQTKVVRKTAFKWTSVDTGIEVDSTTTETRTTERVKP